MPKAPRSDRNLKGNGLLCRLRMSWNIAFLPYGPRWRTWRKIFHEHFHPNASRQYQPRELRAARQLLENLLRTPEHYGHHLRLSVASSFCFSFVDQRFMSSLQHGWAGNHGDRVWHRRCPTRRSIRFPGRDGSPRGRVSVDHGLDIRHVTFLWVHQYYL